jgi:hypothetical protein
MWRVLTTRVCVLIKALAAGAQASFGLSLEKGVSEAAVKSMFARMVKS